MNDEIPSSDPFFWSRKNFTSQIPQNFCKACPQSRIGDFCGVRIQPECLRIDINGVVRVSLSTSARTWFDTLAQFGEVLHLMRNPVAVLGKLGQMPLLEDWRNPVLPRDHAGQFTPNLAEYAGLWAVGEASPKGVLHGLEARDNSGAVFERFLLPFGARRELFERFVTSYQSPPEEAGNWFPPNHTWSAQRRARLAGRIPWLRSRWTAGDRNVRRLPARFLPKLLAAAAKSKSKIRTMFYHPALTRAVIWTPEVYDERTCAGFFHGQDVGLHLNRRAIASVWLWMGQCNCCADQRWSVEMADNRDQPGLAFVSGNKTNESDWRHLIKSCLS